MKTHAPAVARETRVLVTIIAISIAALWILARLRFPERPLTVNPVPPVLAQLAPPSGLDAIVSTVHELSTRLAPVLAPIRLDARRDAPAAAHTAWRIARDLALVVGDPDAVNVSSASSASSGRLDILAADPATGLAIVQLPGDAPVNARWTPNPDAPPRYLFAASHVGTALTLDPVFVAAMSPVESVAWEGTIWILPLATRLPRGTFLFTAAGALAGVAIEHDGLPALVPAESLLVAFQGLRMMSPAPAGRLGITTGPLTSDLAQALGRDAGVVVTWVDPEGPAAGKVLPIDVIVQVNDTPIGGMESWHASTARAVAGTTLAVVLWRGGISVDVQLTAAPAQRERPLGLTLRRMPGPALAIVSVDHGTAAAEARLLAGDIITRVGRSPATTTTTLAQAYAALEAGRFLPLAVTRGQRHLVIALEKSR